MKESVTEASPIKQDQDKRKPCANSAGYVCVLFIVCVCITLYFVYIEVLQNHTADISLVFMFVNCQFSVLHFKHMKVTAYYFAMV